MTYHIVWLNASLTQFAEYEKVDKSSTFRSVPSHIPLGIFKSILGIGCKITSYVYLFLHPSTSVTVRVTS